MGNKQIRIGQLIAPFGPGSLYTDRRGVPHVVCGLDHWFEKWSQTTGIAPCDDRAEFEIFESRLSDLLDVARFCRPPDYRATRAGEVAPPNAGLHVPALRFPRWYRHSKTGRMHRFNMESRRLDNPPDGGRWLPVRFVAVCSAGHLCEFPWKEWLDCQCAGDGNLYLTDRGGSELSSIRVKCKSCPSGSTGGKGKSLAGTTKKPDEERGEQSAFQRAFISCPGDRPWLGEGASETCGQPLVGALINQTNLYFSKTISAIGLPDLHQENSEITGLRNEIEQNAGNCAFAKTLWNMPNKPGAVALVKADLDARQITAEPADVESALESLFSPPSAISNDGAAPQDPESDLLQFRREEFNIIRNGVDDPVGIPNLRVVASDVPDGLSSWFTKVNLVERLRETRVFYGFDRLQQSAQPLADMPGSAMGQLFRTPPPQSHDRWLPAIEVFGEGIYLELNQERLAEWQEENEAWLQSRLDDGFLMRLGSELMTLPPLGGVDRNWASKYLLTHSLSHTLINQFVFECGYSTASLRERLFISADQMAPMAGILIYTAAGDSEGTLGGLVRLGRPDRLESLILRALSRVSWCSADPVCSENLGGQGSRMANLAACHACILLPETSCETINQGLDRAMIVGTPDRRERGFMSELLSNAYALE